MEVLPDVPWMDYEEIRKEADSFLERYHPSITPPIPIDAIAERKLGLNIIPLPGLYNVWDMDGFLYGDLSSIAVDEDVFSHSNPVRYRFTLAHEIGHLILHPQLSRASNIQDIATWKTFVKALPEAIRGKVEYQAYCFAGLVLVPQKPLKQEVEETIKLVKEKMEKLSNDVRVYANSNFLQATIEEMVAIEFEVSRDVISRRMRYDKLDKLLFEM